MGGNNKRFQKKQRCAPWAGTLKKQINKIKREEPENQLAISIKFRRTYPEEHKKCGLITTHATNEKK